MITFSYPFIVAKVRLSKNKAKEKKIFLLLCRTRVSYLKVQRSAEKAKTNIEILRFFRVLVYVVDALAYGKQHRLSLQRIFLKCIKHSGEIALAGIGEQGNDGLAFVLWTLGNLGGGESCCSGRDADEESVLCC